jgi:hypothetical protein
MKEDYIFISKNECPNCKNREWYCYKAQYFYKHGVYGEAFRCSIKSHRVIPIIDMIYKGIENIFDECVNCEIVVS